MVLKDDMNGLLAFTAVKPGGPTNDSGLAGSRFVYGCRLVNGVFGTPFLIHGACLRRIYGWKPTVVIDIPEAIDPLSMLHIRLPEEIIIWQNTGPAGLLEGSGNVMVAPVMAGMDAAAPAQALYNDGNIHSNVTGAMANGMLCTMNLNSGIAEIGAGGQGGGLPRSRAFETKLTPLHPDLAIIGCRLSDQFPAPGSQVDALVDIENLGLGSTPTDDLGRSAAGVEAVFIEASGDERVVSTATVPVLLAGEATLVNLHLEMPHEPVRLRVRLNPNPIDSNEENNSRECVFGAPAPADVICEPIVIDGDPPQSANQIRWRNTGIYDEVLLYRNGSMFASVPGGCTMFIDLYAPPGTQEYCVRGRMGASKSTKTAARCGLSGESFRRGFVNEDGQDDISDAIAILGYLFLGRPTELYCEKAADNNDDGEVNLSDAVFHLSWKFLGGLPPPPPYDACGSDPTPDGLTCLRAIGCP
jgi:hypothetical protein